MSNPSIAAKIDNLDVARPQIGLGHTDLVFEELVEGGLTRYVAVWQSDVPDEVGPVRSIRPMDPDIISPLGGIVVYSGGQARFVTLMQQTGLLNVVHGQSSTGAFFYRTSAKVAPHNVILRAQQLIAANKSIAPPPQLFQYAPTAAASSAVTKGNPAASIALRFSDASARSWAWDAASGMYLRSQDGKADLDDTGAQLRATNVIVVRVPESNDGGVPKAELIGSGAAVVSTGGSSVQATWSKASRTDPIHLVDSSGAPITLGVGNSWIELVPLAGSVTTG